MWRRDKDPAGAKLVAKCEAFLSGRYAEYIEEHDQRAPGWVWINLLAHGGVEELRTARRLLGSGRHWHPSSGDWREARSYLAGEVLEPVDSGRCALHAVQVRVLVPVELRLAAAGDTARLSPSELVATVLAALDEDRIRQRRRSGSAGSRREPPFSA